MHGAVAMRVRSLQPHPVPRMRSIPCGRLLDLKQDLLFKISWRPVQAVLPALVLLFFNSISASGYTALVAFADSYRDTGRPPSSPPYYWNGRFSNGPLWIEHLSQTLGFAYNPANNFAVSGTESNELGVEINNFPGTTDSENVLFAIWSGNNDFVNHL